MSDSNKNANKNTSKKKDEKRTKDEASPGSTPDQPDKRPTGNEKSHSNSSTASASILSTPSAPYTPCSQPLHMFGQYYPPHLQYLSQQQTVPPANSFSPSPSYTNRKSSCADRYGGHRRTLTNNISHSYEQT
ncbi:hypothetical protein DPMN_169235 [Dreissena polymorpha]|uniref:Uncharacterized protein n=1 Tax=Dreissena polymorpha TaxID=45954 RepID=A0A9D4F6Z7_DREPO|nr:hypothetical protein DPMN_169235 [Dreissena polymorpha]